MRILGLCNPSSGAKPERLEHLKRFAADLGGGERVKDGKGLEITVVATRSVAEAEHALRATPLGADDILLVSGGDGTIQHALSWLLHGQSHTSQQSGQHSAQHSAQHSDQPENQRLSARPTIALLPAGSTNMTATDINAQRDWQQCLATLRGHIESAFLVPSINRSLINVCDGDTTRGGFFVGGGAIVRGIEYCNDVLWANGASRQERTAGLAMARTIWGVLRKEPPFDEVDALGVKAVSAGGTALDLSPKDGALLFATSSLERLIVGVRPFWGTEQNEPMPFVLVARDAKLARNLPGLLGVPRFNRPVAGRGFHSHNCTTLELVMESAYAIDGELFVPQCGKLDLSLSEPLRFLEL